MRPGEEAGAGPIGFFTPGAEGGENGSELETTVTGAARLNTSPAAAPRTGRLRAPGAGAEKASTPARGGAPNRSLPLPTGDGAEENSESAADGDEPNRSVLALTGWSLRGPDDALAGSPVGAGGMSEPPGSAAAAVAARAMLGGAENRSAAAIGPLLSDTVELFSGDDNCDCSSIGSRSILDKPS